MTGVTRRTAWLVALALGLPGSALAQPGEGPDHDPPDLPDPSDGPAAAVADRDKGAEPASDRTGARDALDRAGDRASMGVFDFGDIVAGLERTSRELRGDRPDGPGIYSESREVTVLGLVGYRMSEWEMALDMMSEAPAGASYAKQLGQMARGLGILGLVFGVTSALIETKDRIDANDGTAGGTGFALMQSLGAWLDVISPMPFTGAQLENAVEGSMGPPDQQWTGYYDRPIKPWGKL